MPKYHINPQTGNPGTCHAKKNCPFGDIQSDHYDSADQARSAYEQANQEYTVTQSTQTNANKALQKKANYDQLLKAVDAVDSSSSKNKINPTLPTPHPVVDRKTGHWSNNPDFIPVADYSLSSGDQVTQIAGFVGGYSKAYVGDIVKLTNGKTVKIEKSINHIGGHSVWAFEASGEGHILADGEIDDFVPYEESDKFINEYEGFQLARKNK
jgi:hypothetical protein